MLNILIIDNRDSFTYNLVETLRNTGLCWVEVCYVNEAVEYVNTKKYDGMILSPGPGLPKEKRGLFEVLHTIVGKIPILGVCLGHQALAEYLGAKLYQLETIMHGEKSEVVLNRNVSIYKNIDTPVFVGRYHSWAVDKSTLPLSISVSSETMDGIIMSFDCEALKINAVQFHPESILTPAGQQMLENWLNFYVKNDIS